MSLTRYAPQILDSFRLIVARPVAAAAILVPGLALVAGGQVLAGGAVGAGDGAAAMGMLLTTLGITGMGFLWQRVVAEGEALTPVQMAPRMILWMIILQLLQGFELAPT